jgi:RNA polymerase sigma factor (sigma-70 family)
VQEAVAQTLKQLPRLQFEGQGGFHAYLKAAILNRIRNELRSTKRRPQRTDLDVELKDPSRSALDLAMTNESPERYEQALERLSQSDREATIARFEFGFSGPELAAALHKPSVDAARMAVTSARSPHGNPGPGFTAGLNRLAHAPMFGRGSDGVRSVLNCQNANRPHVSTHQDLLESGC